jgi:hypothetical protein
MRAVVDVTGKRYGRLVVLKRAGSIGNYAAWECRCDCGNTLTCRGHLLRSGGTASCGCAQKEAVKNRLLKHGLSRSAEYKTWSIMIQRCTNPLHPRYKDYGGRGISVTPRWMHSFILFYKDMGPRPGPGYSIERDDVNAGYFKDNCRWATKKEQARNRRNSCYVSYRGKSRLLIEVSEELKIPYNTLQNHVRKRPNVPIEELLSQMRSR